jgi:bifunctional UDP-N-acetylglucosamine pyrophosphorylase/glucosamine-1-phosphate N-acetyltransferase
MHEPRITAVILAAGKGTRLKSDRPKVLHEVCHRPMLAYVLDACRAAGIPHCIVVVGHEKQSVMDAFADDHAITWIEQNPQLGTGHAVMVCREALATFDHALVLCGDGPLIRPETLRELLDKHLREGLSATLATAILDDPTGYGRICRDADGNFVGIVEHADATPEQRQIREVNPSYYCFRVADLLPALEHLRPDNAKREYYITDVLTVLRAENRRVAAISSVRPEDVFSINSRQDLALVNRVMRDRILDRLMTDGVTVIDPATTWVDARATIGRDTVLYPFVHITGPVRIGCNCRVGPFAQLSGDVVVGDGATVAPLAGGRI